MFSGLQQKFESTLRSLAGRGKITESNIREAMEEVRSSLLEADVHYEVAERFCENVVERALGTEVLSSVKPGQQMIKIVHDELVRTIGGEEAMAAGSAGDGEGSASRPEPIMFVSPGPTVVMMSGLQGSGKTTTCGKLAAWLKKRGKSVVLAAADLQRPAAVRQLEVLAEQVERDFEGPGRVGFYGEIDKVAEYGRAVNAAVDVCRRAVQHARGLKADVLILDTAGRLHVNDELMNELRLVNAAVQPHHIFLVIDSMTGQDAVNSAKAFNERLELDGVILTKFDSDTRGGAALSVRQVTGKPIRFMGTGEKLDALEAFHADRVAGRILGMGDVVSLVEKAQEQVSAEEAERLQEKVASGSLTMDDFLQQLRTIRRMGSMKSLLGMLPGVGQQLKDLDLDDGQLNRTEAMIQSMTPTERRRPDLIETSRRRRVARGSGTNPTEVSQLVKSFEVVGKMGKQVSSMSTLSRMRMLAGGGGADRAAAMSGGMPGGLGGGGMPRLKGSSRDSSKGGKKFKQRRKRSR